jgi:putative two-component system response regulator
VKLLSAAKKKLLVVDDIEINRVILNELFSEQFDVLEAKNGQEALDLLEVHASQTAVMLLDLMMPVMDGFDVLKAMNKNGLINSIPVILITGENDDEKSLLGYGLGVSDLVHKPFNPDIICRRVNNVVDLYSYKNFLEQKLVDQKKELEQQANRLKESNLFMVDALSTATEFRSAESGEHVKRIRNLVRMLLEKLSRYYVITPEQIDIISSASALHDIGKIAIPDKVLLKPGALTKEEFEIMKTHTLKGCDILSSLHTHDQEYFNYCYEICRHHHERWDGKGYPDGLAGEDISIWAQATSLADVYDALTSVRVYKGAFSHEEATRMIISGDCGTFNPKLIECFVDLNDHLAEWLVSAHSGEKIA